VGGEELPGLESAEASSGRGVAYAAESSSARTSTPLTAAGRSRRESCSTVRTAGLAGMSAAIAGMLRPRTMEWPSGACWAHDKALGLQSNRMLSKISRIAEECRIEAPIFSSEAVG
jgi:hypothetical protein